MKRVIVYSILGFLICALLFALVSTNDLLVRLGLAAVLVVPFLILLNEIDIYRQEKGKAPSNVPFIPILVVYVVTAFFAVSLYLLGSNIYDRMNSQKTTSVVSKVDRRIETVTHEDEDGYEYETDEEICDVYVRYEVNGKQYNQKYGSSSDCKHKIGDKIDIYYRKDNPDKIHSDSELYLYIGITLFTGFVFAIVTFRAFDKKKKKTH